MIDWLMGFTKPCCQLHPAPSTSNQLISTSNQLHLSSRSSFQPPSSSLQHPQQYSNQNIARNWAISPNLGWKFQTWPFWHEIHLHGILEVLIPSPDLDFWNADAKIQFWVNLGSKKTKLFLLSGNWHTWYHKDADSYSRLVSWSSNPKIHFWANLDQKFKAVYFVYKVALTVFQGCWFLFQHQFSEFPTLKFIFGQIWAKKSNRFFRPKKSKLSVFHENWHWWYFEDADSELRCRV